MTYILLATLAEVDQNIATSDSALSSIDYTTCTDSEFIIYSKKCIIPLSKTYAASRESNIELLILVSDFMVNSVLKSTQRYFCVIHGMS